MTAALDLVLAVDIGTSSVRAMVFDAAGAVAARTQRFYTTLHPAPYQEEQDPDTIRSETYRAVSDCLAQDAAATARVGGICFSSQLYGVIALDSADRPLTRNIMWSDARAEPQAEAMKAAGVQDRLYPVTACPMNSMYPIAKLAWLQENAPEIFLQARRFVSIKEYVAAPLIKDWFVDHSMASATGLFDIHRRRWHHEALVAVGMTEDRLSCPVSGIEGFRLVADSPLAGCGLSDHVRVFLGGGDGPLANLGSGASAPGAVNVDLGTSGAARCTVTRPIVDSAGSLWCYCLTDDLWTLGGIVTNVGNAYQWLAANIVGASSGGACDAYALMNRLTADVEPGAGGLYFLPYLRKVRSPHWDGRLKGAIYGLTADHNIGHMARAMLEAIAFDLRSIIALMRHEYAVADRVVLTGGLARSPILPQLLADVLGEEVFVTENAEGSIAGAAILGLLGLGAIDSADFLGRSHPGDGFAPQPTTRRHYERAYRGYARLVEALRVVDVDEGREQ
jgi:gluconokinase